MNYMPIDRWLIFTQIIREARYENVRRELSMTAIRSEWGKAIRSYQYVTKNGYLKQLDA